jgi:hypothetical protein
MLIKFYELNTMKYTMLHVSGKLLVSEVKKLNSCSHSIVPFNPIWLVVDLFSEKYEFVSWDDDIPKPPTSTP